MKVKELLEFIEKNGVDLETDITFSLIGVSTDREEYVEVRPEIEKLSYGLLYKTHHTDGKTCEDVFQDAKNHLIYYENKYGDKNYKATKCETCGETKHEKISTTKWIPTNEEVENYIQEEIEAGRIKILSEGKKVFRIHVEEGNNYGY